MTCHLLNTASTQQAQQGRPRPSVPCQPLVPPPCFSVPLLTASCFQFPDDQCHTAVPLAFCSSAWQALPNPPWPVSFSILLQVSAQVPFLPGSLPGTPGGGGTSFRAFPQVFPAARAACDPRWLTGGGGRQQAAGGGLHGAEVNPENNSLLLLQGSQTGRAQQGEEGGDWASPCQAPAALLARWVTFSAQLFSRREKFLTLRNRVGTFQMGPRLHWSQGPCSLGF